jgi:hypothetical protein
MGAGRRDCGAIQPWVKPEVDPPRSVALPRGGCNLAEFGRDSVSIFSNHFREIRVHYLQVAEEHFGSDHAADGDVACEQDRARTGA